MQLRAGLGKVFSTCNYTRAFIPQDPTPLNSMKPKKASSNFRRRHRRLASAPTERHRDDDVRPPQERQRAHLGQEAGAHVSPGCGASGWSRSIQEKWMAHTRAFSR